MIKNIKTIFITLLILNITSVGNEPIDEQNVRADNAVAAPNALAASQLTSIGNAPIDDQPVSADNALTAPSAIAAHSTSIDNEPIDGQPVRADNAVVVQSNEEMQATPLPKTIATQSKEQAKTLPILSWDCLNGYFDTRPFDTDKLCCKWYCKSFWQSKECQQLNTCCLCLGFIIILPFCVELACFHQSDTEEECCLSGPGCCWLCCQNIKQNDNNCCLVGRSVCCMPFNILWRTVSCPCQEKEERNCFNVLCERISLQREADSHDAPYCAYGKYTIIAKGGKVRPSDANDS